MSSADRVTNSSDLSVERLEPATSAPALEERPPAREVSRKARRRAQSEGEAETETGEEQTLNAPDGSDQPKHKIDSLA
jgi:hypothetical protein